MDMFGDPLFGHCKTHPREVSNPGAGVSCSSLCPRKCGTGEALGIYAAGWLAGWVVGVRGQSLTQDLVSPLADISETMT